MPHGGPGGDAVLVTSAATVLDLGARRRSGERALTVAAAAPVRHVTPEFLAALNCRPVGELSDGVVEVRRGALRAV